MTIYFILNYFNTLYYIQLIIENCNITSLYNKHLNTINSF